MNEKSSLEKDKIRSHTVDTKQNINSNMNTSGFTENDAAPLSKDVFTSENKFESRDLNKSEKTEDKIKEKPQKYSRKSRYLIFVLFMTTNLVMNMDHGIMPAVTKEIKADLDIEEAMLGVFGSMVYFGNLLGILL